MRPARRTREATPTPRSRHRRAVAATRCPSGGVRPTPRDRASQRAAAATCRSAVISLSALKPLPPAPTVAERTTRIRREDAILTDLVARLDAARPTDRDGATALRSFATDWKHLIA